MPKHVQISPSILSADFLNLEADVRLFEESLNPPEWLHIDVMDGHFVPNLTIGPAFVSALKKITSIPLDVHLMIDNPSEQIDWYLDAGADLLTVHIETVEPGAHAKEKGSSATLKTLLNEDAERLLNLLARIREGGAQAGLSLNPHTSVELLLPFYNSIDLVLLMSVHPGFGGQSFIPESLERLAAIRSQIDEREGEVLIEVDGGVDAEIAPLVAAAGADVLVAGNAIYGQDDPVLALQHIREALDQ